MAYIHACGSTNIEGPLWHQFHRISKRKTVQSQLLHLFDGFFLETTHYMSPLDYLFSFFTFKLILVSGLFLDFSSFVNYHKYENMAYLLEGHPEGAHIDIGCYSACIKGTAAAQNNTWREGKDVCQTARQLLLCEMRRSQLFFSHAVIKMVKLCQNVISNKFTNNNIKRPK